MSHARMSPLGPLAGSSELVGHPQSEVYFALIAKAGIQLACFGVEGIQPAIHCADHDLRRKLLVPRPVGDSARRGGRIAFVIPELRPGVRIESDHMVIRRA